MMSRKRASVALPDVYGNRKRFCSRVLQPSPTLCAESCSDKDMLAMCDTEAALMLIKNQFPAAKFQNLLPPIILQHQLYNIVKSRTTVDMQVEELRSVGKIRLFKLGCENRDICIVFAEDYTTHLKASVNGCKQQCVVERFMTDVLPFCNDVNVSKTLVIEQYGFSDNDVTLLVNAGVLTVRDVGSWWLAIPGAGLFVKNFLKGRKAVLSMIKRCKYKEILLTELQKRKTPKLIVFDINYLLHDLIGADLVTSTQTTSGILLRFKDG